MNFLFFAHKDDDHLCICSRMTIFFLLGPIVKRFKILFSLSAEVEKGKVDNLDERKCL